MAQKTFAPRICLNPKCKTTFIPSAAAQKFCCDECRSSAYKEGIITTTKVLDKIKCPECKKMFRPRTRKQIYCCERCRNAYHYSSTSNSQEEAGKYKKIKPGTRAWKLASPYRRMDCMTLAEVQAECRNRGITYRIAQDLYYAHKLPDDFGKTLKRIE